MALSTQAQIAASAASLVSICNNLKASMVIAQEYAKYNGQTDPGWNSLTNNLNPSVIDVNGFIIGTNIKPGDIANAIGSLNAFVALYNGTTFNFGTGSITPNAWGNSVEVVSNPVV
jgi:hypothetical protein